MIPSRSSVVLAQSHKMHMQSAGHPYGEQLGGGLMWYMDIRIT